MKKLLICILTILSLNCVARDYNDVDNVFPDLADKVPADASGPGIVFTTTVTGKIISVSEHAHGYNFIVQYNYLQMRGFTRKPIKVGDPMPVLVRSIYRAGS